MARITMTPVRSSSLKAIGYDPDTSTLRISFKEGGVYEYTAILQTRFDGLKNAVSKGSYFHRYIKDKYLMRKVG